MQAVPIQYIEGPKVDWSVDDGICSMFKTWKLKCKNILKA